MLNPAEILEVVVQKVGKTYLIASKAKDVFFIYNNHVSDKYIINLDNFFKSGDVIKVKVLSFDEQKSRYVASYKEANVINITDRQKPLPTKCGFCNLKKMVCRLISNN